MSLTVVSSSQGNEASLVPLAFQAMEVRDERMAALVAEVSQLSQAVLRMNECFLASQARAEALTAQVGVLQGQLDASEEARRREKDAADEKIKQLENKMAKSLTSEQVKAMMPPAPPPGPDLSAWQRNMGAPLGR